jgi:hypothetical protein
MFNLCDGNKERVKVKMSTPGRGRQLRIFDGF